MSSEVYTQCKNPSNGNRLFDCLFLATHVCYSPHCGDGVFLTIQINFAKTVTLPSFVPKLVMLHGWKSASIDGPKPFYSTLRIRHHISQLILICIKMLFSLQSMTCLDGKLLLFLVWYEMFLVKLGAVRCMCLLSCEIEMFFILLKVS